MNRTVLIFSPGNDVHARAVADRITEISGGYVSPVYVDGATFPVSSTIETKCGGIGGDQLELAEALPEVYSPQKPARFLNPVVSIDMDSVIGIWWRRFRSPVPAKSLGESKGRGSVPDYAVRSTQQTIKGLVLGASSRVTLINDPFLEDRANVKPYQLKAAEQAGLLVAPTLISNRPDSILRFVRHHWDAGHDVVYKSVASNQLVAFTQQLKEADLEKLSAASHCPTIFQRRVPGFDVRIAVTASRMFALGEHSSEVDVRLDNNSTYLPYELSQENERLIRRLHQILGLTFASYDFKCDAEGRLWFLEVNPSGQWLWLEVEGGFPLSAVVASMLIGKSEYGDWSPYTDSDFERFCPDMTENAMHAAYERAVAASTAAE
ncbi:MAG: hypothetical protein AABP62_24940 [Planctomycetota bacterium]